MNIEKKQMIIICDCLSDMFKKLADSLKEDAPRRPNDTPDPIPPFVPKAASAPVLEAIKEAHDVFAAMDASNAKDKKPSDKPILTDFQKPRATEAVCFIGNTPVYLEYGRTPAGVEFWNVRKDAGTKGVIKEGEKLQGDGFEANGGIGTSYYLKNKGAAGLYFAIEGKYPSAKEKHKIVLAMGQAKKLYKIVK
jgi:hypothetical protein